MNAATNEELFQDTLAKLQHGWSKMDWSQRLEVAQKLQQALLQQELSDTAIELARLLASDPKWEVRHAVAGAIHELPTNDFQVLAEVLGADQHAYVRKCAAQAVRFRQKESREASKTCREVDCIAEQLAAIEKSHGKVAATRALRLCNQYTGLLVGAMVHDLRSILTGLHHSSFGLIESIKGQQLPKEAVTYRRGLQRQVELLNLSIADMEAFAQDVPTSRTLERLADVVHTALALARENVEKAGLDTSVVTVAISVPGNLRIAIARHQILMAFTNLLKNSLESYMTPGRRLRPGRIRVDATSSPGMVSLVIADNGMGLSDAESRGLRIFTPARRNKTKPYSSGYGVPIAARNIFAHGGTFQLESEENVGTTVTITLPLPEK
jgi:signal transduction histidine kinase